jgi:hypothetical protein
MFFLGVACAISGARFFLAPTALERTSVGRALPGLWDEAWSACFLIGGILIMAGVGLRRPRLELPGITLAMAATISNGIAIVITNGAPALSQLPLYVLALWVFDGRARDLRDLPRERRRGNGDPRAIDERVERRVLAVTLPAVALIVAAQDQPAEPNVLVLIIVAVLGGGMVTAVVQALMYRPQKRSLEATLSRTAVEAADIALRQALARADELEDELEEARSRISELEAAVAELRRSGQ